MPLKTVITSVTGSALGAPDEMFVGRNDYTACVVLFRQFRRLNGFSHTSLLVLTRPVLSIIRICKFISSFQ